MAEKKSSTKKTKAKEEPKAKAAETASAPPAEKKTEKEPKPKKVEETKAEVAEAPVPVRGNPVVSFERWFAARSKQKRWKPHWLAGMRAYADTSGRKSIEEWDRIFKNY